MEHVSQVIIFLALCVPVILFHVYYLQLQTYVYVRAITKREK